MTRVPTRLRASMLALGVFCVGLTLAAAPALSKPITMPAQGVLTAVGNAPAADGDYVLSFALYDGPGPAAAKLWGETHLKVPVVGGRFVVQLGSVDPALAPLDSSYVAVSAPRFVGVAVAGEPELPRVALPFAPRARFAEQAILALEAQAAKSLDCTGCVTSQHLAPGALLATNIGADETGGLPGGNVQAQLDAIAKHLWVQGATAGLGMPPAPGCALNMPGEVCAGGVKSRRVLEVADQQALEAISDVGAVAYVSSEDAFFGRMASSWQQFVMKPYCGNGKVEAGESCDDGDGDDSNACNNACKVGDGFPCSGDAVCSSGTCRLDLDGVGSFCAVDASSCVDATVGTPATPAADGAIACTGLGEHACNAGVWSAPTPCQQAGCNAAIALGAQTCTPGQGCMPKPAPETDCAPYACDAGQCKNSCADDNDCAPGLTCNNGQCLALNLNTPNSILAGSEYSGPFIPGYVQCAGWQNTGAWDILRTDWMHSCAGNGTKKWKVILYNPANGQKLFEDTFPSYTQSELNNNRAGCSDSGYGANCGVSSADGTGRALLVYKPNNGNGGCHGDDNSSGAFRVATTTDGSQAMGKNYVFVGGRESNGNAMATGAYRAHKFNSSNGSSEIRFKGNNQLWDGCDHDDSVPYAITIYLEQ